MPKSEVEKTRNFRSLTVILTITFFTLVAVILIIVGVLTLYFNFTAQREIITKQQNYIAYVAASEVNNFIQDRLSVLEAAVNVGGLADAQKEEKELVLDKLLGFRPAFRQLILFNAKEEELLRVSRISKLLSAQLMEYNKTEVFYRVSQKEVYISSIYVDKITSEPLVIIAVPVTDVFGEFQGTLMADVNLKFIWDLVAGIKIGEKGLVYVVDRQGNLIAFSDVSRVLKRENLIYLEEVNQFVKGDELTHKNTPEISRGIQGALVVANHAHLDKPNWAVVVELPVIEAYSSLIRQIILSVAIILSIFGLAIWAVIYFSKKITKPIKELTATAQTITGRNLTERAKISSRDEVGQLALSFNKMVDSLEKEQAFTKNIVQTMPVSLVVVNSDAMIQAVNKTTCELLGYTEEELVGQPVGKVFDHALTKTIFRGAELQELMEGITVKDKQLMFRTKKNQEIPLAISESMVKDEEGKLEYVVVIAKDMREILKLEEEKRKAEAVAAEKEIKSLKNLDKLKDDFLNIAAHELKTPLTSIIGLSEIMKEQAPLFDFQHQNYINIIHEEGNRLAHIVKRILTVTRYESARETVYSEPFNLTTFVSSLLPSLKMLANKKKSRIVIEIEKKDIAIRSDKEKISQVIYNFVDNAVKYGPEGQTITISIAEVKKGQIKIAVTDQGKGITPALQERLFLKFSQLEPSLSRSREGTGLGLYICKLIVDQLGGKIGVKSEPNKGSTFFFTLPILNSVTSKRY